MAHPEHRLTYELAWYCSCGVMGGPCPSEAEARAAHASHLADVADEDEVAP